MHDTVSSTSENWELTDDEPLALHESGYGFIETLEFSVYKHSTSGKRFEVLLKFNYGAHTRSTGTFSVIYNKILGGEVRPCYARTLSLGPTKEIATRKLKGAELPEYITAGLVESIDKFEPVAERVPGYSDRDDAPAITTDMTTEVDGADALLVDHPNLAQGDDSCLGEYQLPDETLPGVVVHTPKWRHMDVDGDEYHWAVTGDGMTTKEVKNVLFNGESLEETDISSIGWVQRYYPVATVTVRGDTAFIWAQTDRVWEP